MESGPHSSEGLALQGAASLVPASGTHLRKTALPSWCKCKAHATCESAGALAAPGAAPRPRRLPPGVVGARRRQGRCVCGAGGRTAPRRDHGSRSSEQGPLTTWGSPTGPGPVGSELPASLGPPWRQCRQGTWVWCSPVRCWLSHLVPGILTGNRTGDEAVTWHPRTDTLLNAATGPVGIERAAPARPRSNDDDGNIQPRLQWKGLLGF